MSEVYRKLAKHLDRLPSGFPATESGVELKILKRLFTPHEAEVALGLTLRPEPAEDIAKRLKKEAGGIAETLESMSRKGLIFSMKKNGQDLFMAAQFLIGIWEYHVNDLDRELIEDFNEYIPHFMKKSWFKQKTKQLRVIPIAKSISAEMSVMPYEEAENIVRGQSDIVLAPCICRKEHAMIGKGCGRLLESCLVFGSGAQFYKKNGLGRAISQEQALEVLNEAAGAGFVLQPGNAKKPSNICLCCGCCCQILKNTKALDQPAKAVCSNFYAEVDEAACTACGVCRERCQLDAVSVDDTARIDLERCIGCGLCVAACDFEAVRLVKKPEHDRWEPPESTFKTYMKIARERDLELDGTTKK